MDDTRTRAALHLLTAGSPRVAAAARDLEAVTTDGALAPDRLTVAHTYGAGVSAALRAAEALLSLDTTAYDGPQLRAFAEALQMLAAGALADADRASDVRGRVRDALTPASLQARTHATPQAGKQSGTQPRVIARELAPTTGNRRASPTPVAVTPQHG